MSKRTKSKAKLLYINLIFSTLYIFLIKHSHFASSEEQCDEFVFVLFLYNIAVTLQ